MRSIGIIPARMASSRYPGKPMANIIGMPMIGHCYHRTRLAVGLDAVAVATCDQQIMDYIHEIGGDAIMTAGSHNRATTRTAEALELIENKTGKEFDIIVMVQGDEPLIPPKVIANTLSAFEDKSVEIVNVMSLITSLEAFKDVNNVKVVCDINGNALYFSREPIPSPWRGWKTMPCYMQTGVIAFRREALIRFNSMDETPLEQYESVDMNRILENRGIIRMLPFDKTTIGVDNEKDLLEVEQLLKNDPIVGEYIR